MLFIWAIKVGVLFFDPQQMRPRHRRIRYANGGEDRLFALLIAHMQVSALPAAT